jgi:hypothetical protein
MFNSQRIVQNYFQQFNSARGVSLVFYHIFSAGPHLAMTPWRNTTVYCGLLKSLFDNI